MRTVSENLLTPYAHLPQHGPSSSSDLDPRPFLRTQEGVGGSLPE